MMHFGNGDKPNIISYNMVRYMIARTN